MRVVVEHDLFEFRANIKELELKIHGVRDDKEYNSLVNVLEKTLDYYKDIHQHRMVGRGSLIFDKTYSELPEGVVDYVAKLYEKHGGVLQGLWFVPSIPKGEKEVVTPIFIPLALGKDVEVAIDFESATFETNIEKLYSVSEVAKLFAKTILKAMNSMLDYQKSLESIFLELELVSKDLELIGNVDLHYENIRDNTTNKLITTYKTNACVCEVPKKLVHYWLDTGISQYYIGEMLYLVRLATIEGEDYLYRVDEPDFIYPWIKPIKYNLTTNELIFEDEWGKKSVKLWKKARSEGCIPSQDYQRLLLKELKNAPFEEVLKKYYSYVGKMRKVNDLNKKLENLYVKLLSNYTAKVNDSYALFLVPHTHKPLLVIIKDGRIVCALEETERDYNICKNKKCIKTVLRRILKGEFDKFIKRTKLGDELQGVVILLGDEAINRITERFRDMLESHSFMDIEVKRTPRGNIVPKFYYSYHKEGVQQIFGKFSKTLAEDSAQEILSGLMLELL